MSGISLSIVLPCYNEAGNLPGIFDRLQIILAGREDVEVILVNNGSTDNSAEVFNTQMARPGNKFARVVLVPVNKGYGYGIMSGLREAQGSVLAWTHADLQTDPGDVLKAHAVFVSQADPEKTFLKGRRTDRNPLDNIFTLGMSLVCSVVLGKALSDINAQPKMFARSFLACLAVAPDDFSLDLYALYMARKLELKLVEYPVSFAARHAGAAKGGGTLRGKIKLTRRTFSYIWKLRRTLVCRGRQGRRT